MTVEQFRNLVFAMARTEGTPYLKPTDTALLTDLCQEQLNVYANRTHCLQSDFVTFTPVIGTPSYATFTPAAPGSTTIPAAFSAALCDVRQVYIDGAALRICGDDQGRYGESSELLVARTFGAYQAAASARPAHWWQEPPNTLRFNCPFDQVYTKCWVAGRLYHSPLLLDQQVLDLPPDDIRPAARLACAELLYPNAREKAMAMLGLCEIQMKKRKAECSAKQGGLPQRGSSEPVRMITLG